MSAEENKAVVRRLIEEVWNDHDFTDFEEVVAENHFDHMAVPQHQRPTTGRVRPSNVRLRPPLKP